MKKIIIPLLLLLLMSVGILAWGAERTILDNKVTLTVDPTEGTGIFTLEETVSAGVTISNYPTACGLAGSILTCDYETGGEAIVYQTTGTGSVTGIIVGGYPAGSLSITGDSEIPAPTTAAGEVTALAEEDTTVEVKGCTSNFDCASNEVCDTATGNCVPVITTTVLSGCPSGQLELDGKCQLALEVVRFRLAKILDNTTSGKLDKLKQIAQLLRDYFASQ